MNLDFPPPTPLDYFASLVQSDTDLPLLEAAASLSTSSMAAYRALVYETPGFTDYFFGATPIRAAAPPRVLIPALISAQKAVRSSSLMRT